MWLYVASFFGASAVLLGALGAHGLAHRVSPERLADWNTAASYHLAHALALLALSLYARSTGRSVAVPAWLFTAGITAFSGSIYLLVLTSQKWLGPITPIGGLCLTGGWIALVALARSGR